MCGERESNGEGRRRKVEGKKEGGRDGGKEGGRDGGKEAGRMVAIQVGNTETILYLDFT